MMKESTTSRNIFLLCTAVLLITLFSACSPLYPVNPWSDPNWYITIGKGMLHGQMPYRDLWDQKGPSLFMLQGLMALISQTTYLGVYLVEIACLWVSMVFSYKTMRLFSDNPICLPLTCVLAWGALASDFFYWGETVEELCLPTICYPSYKLLVYAKKDELPSWKSSVLIGLGMGFVFWCKFTILTFHIGAVIALLCIAYNRRDITRVRKPVMQITAGFLMFSAVLTVFYLAIGAFSDMIDGYFVTNLVHYDKSHEVQMNALFRGLRIVGAIILIGLPCLIKADRNVKYAVLLPWAVTILFFTFAPIDWYYFVILFYALPFSIYWFRRISCSIRTKMAFATFCLFATMLNYNICTLVTGQFPETVCHMADIINHDPNHTKELLCYNSHATAIYLETDCQAPIKYFSAPLSKVNYRPMQDSCLASCRSKYVIVKTHHLLNNYHDMDKNKDYRLIYQTKENFRYPIFENPLAYLWSLGYTHALLKPFYTPDKDTYTKKGYTYKLYILRSSQHQLTVAGNIR